MILKKPDTSGPVALFAGTTEGKVLARALKDAQVPTRVFVATDYGNSVFSELEGLDIEEGRKDLKQMVEAIKGFDLVIDTTHPFAIEVSQNIREATQKVGIEYLRVKREETPLVGSEHVIFVNSYEEAVTYLKSTKGNILLTTGSKTLSLFTKLDSFKERLYVRMLPDASLIEDATNLGIKASHIIALQGPFSADFNLALIRSTKAKYLVTKDSGTSGGFEEKVEAAKISGITLVCIRRPQEVEDALTLDDAFEILGLGPLAIPVNEVPEEISQYPRFPLFINIADKECLVVGGGTVGMRRAKALAQFGAKVSLVEPQSVDVLPEFTLIKRVFENSDIKGKYLVIAATNCRATNAHIASLCRRNKILINVADAPGESTFYFPAIIQGEQLVAGMISKVRNYPLVRRAAHELRTVVTKIENENNE